MDQMETVRSFTEDYYHYYFFETKHLCANYYTTSGYLIKRIIIVKQQYLNPFYCVQTNV